MRAAAPGAADADGWTPLHFAAQAQAPAVVEVLLAEGAAVDVVDRHGDTPLSRAVFCSRGEGGTIRLLLQAGADPDRDNVHGMSRGRWRCGLPTTTWLFTFRLGETLPPRDPQGCGLRRLGVTERLSDWVRQRATGALRPDGAGSAVGVGVDWRLWALLHQWRHICCWA
ncbi:MULTISPECIES: ankyrin repeat domain-containing protein [unclassified Streptomyces]|uniref:ankyrin repeat domain-containing protein n=1 Tax=unclassified Streptomyces TaxID=2593676 RepID=UPI003676B045